MFDLVFLELLTLNLHVTLRKKLWPLALSFDVGSAALSTSVQNFVTTCCNFDESLWPLPMFCVVGSAALSTSVQNVVTTCSQRFDRKSIEQCCRLVCIITRIRLAGLILVSV